MTTKEELIKIHGISENEIVEWSNLSDSDKDDVARVLLEDGYEDGHSVIDNAYYSPDEFHFTQGYITFDEDDEDDVQAHLDASKKTYDVQFDDDAATNSKGWRESFEYCKDYIETNNGTDTSYFADYKGGVVSIICNETDEIVYTEDVR